ncbi:Methyltransf_21 domain-containing protein [Meloidogyne graminicola]|uniref:Methyltransf_21 domain-containing protein n=1 Tax=Meloidogyne graminicola TaxID=189291 RepID=A0A8S9ZN77_9BILA|nr:Methyltransf_21 domain-containing protein [Meloidogyne graminicola]
MSEPAIGFFDFFIYYNANQVIDMLFLDIEGNEFSIFQLFTEQYNLLPVIICQINIEFHHHHLYSNTFLRQRFLRNLDTFFRYSKFAMLKNDIFKPNEIFHRINVKSLILGNIINNAIVSNIVFSKYISIFSSLNIFPIYHFHSNNLSAPPSNKKFLKFFSLSIFQGHIHWNI